jgi:hypothetical protein
VYKFYITYTPRQCQGPRPGVFDRLASVPGTLNRAFNLFQNQDVMTPWNLCHRLWQFCHLFRVDQDSLGVKSTVDSRNRLYPHHECNLLPSCGGPPPPSLGLILLDHGLNKKAPPLLLEKWSLSSVTSSGGAGKQTDVPECAPIRSICRGILKGDGMSLTKAARQSTEGPRGTRPFG